MYPGSPVRVLSRPERTLHADELNILYFVIVVCTYLYEWHSRRTSCRARKSPDKGLPYSLQVPSAELASPVFLSVPFRCTISVRESKFCFEVRDILFF